jgi:hypothetical protein
MNAYYHDYPDTPGHRGVDTSIEAADAIAPHSGRLERMVLFAIREVGDSGLTSEELADRLAIDFGSVQPRTSELRRKGLIEDRGARRPNRKGRRTIVWCARADGGRS